jgi:hypothetical protein
MFSKEAFRQRLDLKGAAGRDAGPASNVLLGWKARTERDRVNFVVFSCEYTPEGATATLFTRVFVSRAIQGGYAGPEQHLLHPQHGVPG